eukprot:gene22201-29262_t
MSALLNKNAFSARVAGRQTQAFAQTRPVVKRSVVRCQAKSTDQADADTTISRRSAMQAASVAAVATLIPALPHSPFTPRP